MVRYSRVVRHRGVSYKVRFSKRPFREGLEVAVKLRDGTVLRVGELGLGEQALLEKLGGEIDRHLNGSGTPPSLAVASLSAP